MRINVYKELELLDLQSNIDNYTHTPINTFHGNTTVRTVIDEIRAKHSDPHIHYFYVLNDNNDLVGVISSHQLLESELDAPISQIMETRVIKVTRGTSLGDSLHTLAEHHLASLPVVDNENHLLGVVEIEQTSEINLSPEGISTTLKKSNARDIYQLIGLSMDKTQAGSHWAGFRNRMPWLVGNLVAGLICAAIAAYFSDVLDYALTLAMFIPLVLTLNESIAMQAMTLNLFFLHHKRITWKLVKNRLLQEWKTTLFLGLTACLCIGGVYMVLHNDMVTMMSLSVSIFVSMFFSATIGILLPVILQKLSKNPRVAAGPIVLMGTDIITTAIYLGLATWMIL